MRLPWVVLALALAAPTVLAAPTCEPGAPCTVEVTLDPSARLAVAQPDIAAGWNLVLVVSNQANQTVNVTIDGTSFRMAVDALSNATSSSFSLGPGNHTLREDAANTSAPLTIGPAVPAVLPPGGAADDDASLLAVILPVIVGLALVGIANLVVRNGRDHRHNLFFAGLYFLSGLKSISEGLAVKADSFHAGAALFPPQAFWDLLGIFCALGMMPLLLLFVSSFPRPVGWMLRSPRLAALAFLPSALVTILLVLFVTGQLPPDLYIGAAQGFNICFFAVTVIAIVLLMRTRSRSPDAIERTQSTYVLLGFLPAFLTGWAVSGLQLAEGSLVDPAVAGATIDTILHFVSPVFELVACSLVGFAILKYNILGINPRFRLGVKSVLAGAMFLTLFMVTQFIENVVLQGKVFAFAGDYGSFILSGATGIVLFKPIEKVSGRASDKLLPGAAAVVAAQAAADEGVAAAHAPAAQAAVLHAEQIYHAQCTYVLRDAQVTERELALLRNLRTQLGLTEDQARRIEQEVEVLLKVDAPETGNAATPPPPAGADATTPASPATAAPPADPPEGAT
jgi:hypothetical protein